MNRMLGWLAGAAGLMVVAGAVAQTNAPSPAAPEPTSAYGGSPDSRYAKLTLKSLPPLEVVLQAAMDSLPEIVPSTPDWSKRMRQATFVPRVEVRYGIGEQRFRDFTVIDRTETSSGFESTRESSQSTAFQSPSGDSSAQRTDSRGSRSTSSTTQLGPDSYSAGEHPKWLDAWELALTWDFSQLFFRPEEINAAQMKMDAARLHLAREPFVAESREKVITAYYDLVESLRMLQLETYRTSVPTLMRKERAAAMVDDMTGGCLTKHLKKAAKP